MSPVALITGGQRGIGLAIAEALSGAGWRIALASSAAPSDRDVAAALPRFGTSARYYEHDVRAIDAHDALLQRIEADLGPVTTLISNAGISARSRGDMLEMEAESFDAVMDVNLRGAFFLAQAAAQRMIAQPAEPYRCIAFVTSVSAAMASVERAEYCISKAGAAMAAQLFAARLAPHDIGVFELRPGIIETAMTAGVKDAYTPRIEAGLVPARRWGRPSDIGSVVVPLAEGRFAFATGTAIAIDGGLSIPRL